MSYLVLLDSNSIIANNYSIKTSRIENFIKAGNKIVITSVTFEEVCRNYEKHQLEIMRKLDEEAKKSSRFGIQVNYKKESSEIRSVLRAELELLNVEVVDNTHADIELIYQKALNLKKPFKSKQGKESGGFKDALIWSNFISYVKEKHHEFEMIVLVTNDSDFINIEERVLEEELIEDLIKNKIPKEKVIVFLTIKELLESPIFNFELPNNPVENIFIEDKIDEIINTQIDALKNNLQESLEELLGEGKEPYIEYLLDLDNVKLKEEKTTKLDNQINFYFTEEFEVNCLYFLPKEDYFVTGKANINIVDNDWNDWVFLVSETFYVEVGFDVIGVIEENELVVEEVNYYFDSKFVPATNESIYEYEIM